MNRPLIPGIWGRCGRAIPDPQACELDANVAYPLETLHQGRDAKTSVPRISMLSGIPRTEEDDQFRAVTWRIALAVLIVVWGGLAAVAVRAGYAYGILR